MVKIEIPDQHIWVKSKPTEVIIDKKQDVRICDGSHVVKVRLWEVGKNAGKIRDILVDDRFVWRA